MPRRSVASICVFLSLLCAISGSPLKVWATELPKSVLQFEIPAQPLASAVSSFSAIAGIEVLVPAELLAQKHSPGVTGTMTSEAALRALLSDTGLVPRLTDDGLLTVVAITQPATPPRSTPPFARYSAALQNAITTALCHVASVKPGDYRVAARLWVRQGGEVAEVGILGTTGDHDRDLLLEAALKRVVVGESPPPGLQQPTTILVLPRSDSACEGLEGRAP
jgi:hypothetical protein